MDSNEPVVELDAERKAVIDTVIDRILKPYKSNLQEFSLEKIRERFGLRGIATYNFSQGICAQLVQVKDAYFIGTGAAYAEDKVTIAHELGHLVLEHLIARQIQVYGEPLSKLSGFQLWERQSITHKDTARPGLLDSTQERTEVEYFSKRWNERLEGVDWLTGVRRYDFRDEENPTVSEASQERPARESENTS